ncbi:hypothetical protein AG1IA_06259 [Rhizoctonia solani AG-1 IA]|uniref:Uncharacterized protein n=1 Tax=Thanatephorus cucumeris (strain AG1-IA) TaxID=983506 RepID=L8WNH1_THACA|nr:hypothetical protein AG1IA_06259 [Rhizoctonia solani AG-1 IA]
MRQPGRGTRRCNTSFDYIYTPSSDLPQRRPTRALSLPFDPGRSTPTRAIATYLLVFQGQSTGLTLLAEGNPGGFLGLCLDRLSVRHLELLHWYSPQPNRRPHPQLGALPAPARLDRPLGPTRQVVGGSEPGASVYPIPSTSSGTSPSGAPIRLSIDGVSGAADRLYKCHFLSSARANHQRKDMQCGTRSLVWDWMVWHAWT